MVAPAVDYVDHELSANLDSTFAFEGPEKLLEIWVWSHEDQAINEGLRSIPFDQWVKILDLVNCKVLSMKSTKYMDSYLLSESSLFVYPHKMILKTCGTTTTLNCIDYLFDTIQGYISKKLYSKEAYKVFYSRRSFMFPEKQKNVHRDWKNEVKLLNENFSNGKSYVVGDFMSDDHWYLYVGGKDCRQDEYDNDDGINNTNKDQTFEILMTDLDPVNAEQFVTSRKPGYESLINKGFEEHDLGHDFGLDTMASTSLDGLFNPPKDCCDETDCEISHLPSPKEEDGSINDTIKFTHDAFSFTPCGFSSNSVSSNHGGYYYTLHVTPESGWSYASFETNYPFSNSSPIEINDVLTKILTIFSPGKFSVTLISELENCSSLTKELNELFNCNLTLKHLNYKKNERILYDLNNNYKLLYLNFEKN